MPSCLLTDSLMVFVVLQLKDAPESGLDGLGDYLRYGGPGFLCVSPKISKHVANFYWKSSGEKEPPQRAGLWQVETSEGRNQSGLGFPGVQPCSCPNTPPESTC